MNQRDLTFAVMRALNIKPIPFGKGKKSRLPEADMKDHLVVNKDFEQFEGKDWNIGGWVSGLNVDIDVDGTNEWLPLALDLMLPHTKFVFGRESRKRSHRIYVLGETFDNSEFSKVFIALKKNKEFTVEIKGGRPNTQGLIVMPGSIHPSGEEVQWSDAIDPTESPEIVEKIDLLLKRIRMAVVVARFCAIWADGQRNELSLAYTGMMFRISMSNQMNPDGIQLDQADCMEMLNAVLQLADPTKGDHNQRRANFNNTWKAMVQNIDRKTTGAQRISDIMGADGPEFISHIFSLLSDNPETGLMDMFADSVVLWEGKGHLVRLDRLAVRDEDAFLTKEQAQNSFGNKWIQIGDKKKPLAQWLYSTDMIKRVNGVAFEPSTDERLIYNSKGCYVNFWSGFEGKAHPSPFGLSDHPQVHEYFTEILCKGDPGRLNWAMSWLADIFQNPGEKPGTSLILVGVQGAGKTFLGEKILKPLLGRSLYSHFNDLEQVAAKFNQRLGNKMLLHVDESTMSNQRNLVNRLKSIVTDETVLIEPKGLNQFEVNNYARLFVTSNLEEGAIHVDPESNERRFTIFGTSIQRAKDVAWWAKLIQWVKEDTAEGNPSKLMRMFMDWKVDKDLIRRPHMTEEKKRMQNSSLGDNVNWLLTRMAQGHPLSPDVQEHWWQAYCEENKPKTASEQEIVNREGWPEFVQLAALTEDYRQYLTKLRRFIPKGAAENDIKALFPKDTFKQSEATRIHYSTIDKKTGVLVKDRTRVNTFPSMVELKDFLLGKFGDTIEERLREIVDDSVGTEKPTDYEGYVKSNDTK